MKCFIPKTGYTGFYTLLFTFGIYLFSKEIYVCDHEFYNGISMIICCVYATKKFGKNVGVFLDTEIDKYLEETNKMKQDKIDEVQSLIYTENELQACSATQNLVVLAKKINVAAQLEAEFRKRQMTVYNEVKRILDYHTETTVVKKNLLKEI